MNAAWQVRRANEKDADGLTKCMQSAYAIYQARMGGERLPPKDIDYLKEINFYPTWVVEHEGNIIGGLVMMFENEKALIANIAVDSKFQGKGVGGALMNFAESKVRERNFSEIHLATHVLLEENLALYQHLGWRQTGRDSTKVFMKKVI